MVVENGILLYTHKKSKELQKILYKYDAWGGRDSHAYGYAVLDSTEIFSVNVDNTRFMTTLTNRPRLMLLPKSEI